jgi:hypothetical protein
MQHNVTGHHECSQTKQQVSHPATVSKRGAAQGAADRSGACRPITKRTQSARQPTVRTIQNATQCNTMLLAVTGNNRCRTLRQSQKRAQPRAARNAQALAAPLRSEPNPPRNQRFERSKMQHNATQCYSPSPMQSERNNRCRISLLSQKREQPNGSNETQCNAMQHQIEVSKHGTAVPLKTSTASVRAVRKLAVQLVSPLPSVRLPRPGHHSTHGLYPPHAPARLLPPFS